MSSFNPAHAQGYVGHVTASTGGRTVMHYPPPERVTIQPMHPHPPEEEKQRIQVEFVTTAGNVTRTRDSVQEACQAFKDEYGRYMDERFTEAHVHELGTGKKYSLSPAQARFYAST